MNVRKAGLLAAVLVVAVHGNAMADEAKSPEIRTSTLTNLNVERSYSQPFATDELTFELAPAKTPGWRLEYKVSTRSGDALLYSLTATGPVISEFHGQFNDESVAFYREESGTTASHGQLIAPADGMHGWYIANATDKPVKVTLKLSGRYDKAPGLIKFSK